MAKRHQAALRLVGGIDCSNSSRDKSTPRLSASRFKRMCHLPGMPIDGQFRTVESGIEKASESGRAPPNRATISLAQSECDLRSMNPKYPFNGQNASPFSGGRPKNGNQPANPHNGGMAKEKRIRQPVVGVPFDDEVVKRQMAERLKVIRKAIAPNVGALAASLGVPPSTYRNYESATSWLPYDVIVRLAHLGANLDYLFYGLGPPKREPQPKKKAASKKRTAA